MTKLYSTADNRGHDGRTHRRQTIRQLIILYAAVSEGIKT